MKLNHVFRVSFLSCADSSKWIERLFVRQTNECKSTPAQLAGNIAAHHLKVYERGVRVEYIGLEEDLTKGGKKPQPIVPITPVNPFVLTLERTSSTVI